MRVKYKGFFLVADYSFSESGKVVAGIFRLPDHKSVEEFETYDSVSDTMKTLKAKIREMLNGQKTISVV